MLTALALAGRFLTSRWALPIGLVMAIAATLLVVKGKFDAETRRADRAEAAAKTWHDAYAGWHAYGLAEQTAFSHAEQLRGAEADIARAGVRSAQIACHARADEARRSANAITTLLNQESARVPSSSADGTCPVRELLDPGSLHNALQPAAARAPGG